MAMAGAWVTALLTGLLLAALGGCATVTPGGPHNGGEPHDYGVPGAVESVATGVRYYPACGDETLDHDGRRWFQFTPSNLQDFPDPAVALDSRADAPAGVGGGAPGAVAASAPRVVAPGPGDDIGTLVVYAEGFAYWVSDSGRLDTWLTSREQRYNWVC